MHSYSRDTLAKLANMGTHVVAPPYPDCLVVLVNLQSWRKKYYRLSTTLTINNLCKKSLFRQLEVWTKTHQSNYQNTPHGVACFMRHYTCVWELATEIGKDKKGYEERSNLAERLSCVFYPMLLSLHNFSRRHALKDKKNLLFSWNCIY